MKSKSLKNMKRNPNHGKESLENKETSSESFGNGLKEFRMTKRQKERLKETKKRTQRHEEEAEKKHNIYM